jgi:hypothetical protein
MYGRTIFTMPVAYGEACSAVPLYKAKKIEWIKTPRYEKSLLSIVLF